MAKKIVKRPVGRAPVARSAQLCVGLDPSLSSFGLAVLGEDSAVTRVVKSRKVGVERLIDIRDQVFGIIAGLRPSIIVVEDYAWGAKGRGVISLGELGGVLRVALFEYCSIVDEPPLVVFVQNTAAKKFATGSGNAKKEMVLRDVWRKWGVECATSDEADAYVLAKIGAAIVGAEKPTLKYEIAVLEQLIGVTDDHGRSKPGNASRRR